MSRFSQSVTGESGTLDDGVQGEVEGSGENGLQSSSSAVDLSSVDRDRGIRAGSESGRSGEAGASLTESLLGRVRVNGGETDGEDGEEGARNGGWERRSFSLGSDARYCHLLLMSFVYSVIG